MGKGAKLDGARQPLPLAIVIAGGIAARFQGLETTPILTSKAWKKRAQNFQRLENRHVLRSKAWKQQNWETLTRPGRVISLDPRWRAFGSLSHGYEVTRE